MKTAQINILHVEDDHQIAALVHQVLRTSSNMEVHIDHVSSAADALEFLSNRRTDIVLLDLGLPDSQGFNTILQLRTSFPNTPVVILTGSTDEQIGIQAVECGAQDVISKELVSGKLLLRSIQFALARHNQISLYKLQARTDPLTGLYNRQAFEAELKRQIASWKRGAQQHVSLLFLDVDHFKQVNDTHGHRVGDYVLSRLADVITDSFRESDFVVRYGGEEFAVLLPEIRLDSAYMAAEQLLQAIRSASFFFESLCLRISASIGIASMRPEDDACSLVERADQALYAAKDAGRDQSCKHDGQRVVHGACDAFEYQTPSLRIVPPDAQPAEHASEPSAKLADGAG